MDNATTTAHRPAAAQPIPPGARCRFGPGIVRAYPDGDRYEVVAEDDGSHRLGVLREQLRSCRDSATAR